MISTPSNWLRNLNPEPVLFSSDANLFIVFGGLVLAALHLYLRSASAFEEEEPRAAAVNNDGPQERLPRADGQDDSSRLGPAQGFPGGAVRCAGCGKIHPAGLLFCECGEATSEYDPADHDSDLVCIHEAPDLWKARMLSDYLADHCIPCELAQESGQMNADVNCSTRIRIFVASEDEEPALAVLRRIR